MNYYAHGCRFVDRPYFLVGTAIPDLLRVSDKGVRVHSKRVSPFADGGDSPRSQLAAGILQHLADDDAFHGTAAFIQVSSQLSTMFKASMPVDDGLRPSFLGHITTEMILDSILIEKNSGGLDAYYDALLRVDPQVVLDSVNQMTRDPAVRLAEVIPLFHREQFLRDYANPVGLLHRLNQVLRRVTLPPLPAEAKRVLESAWPIVEHWADQLLPYKWPAVV